MRPAARLRPWWVVEPVRLALISFALITVPTTLAVPLARRYGRLACISRAYPPPCVSRQAQTTATPSDTDPLLTDLNEAQADLMRQRFGRGAAIWEDAVQRAEEGNLFEARAIYLTQVEVRVGTVRLGDREGLRHHHPEDP
jgi:hypothetical protein